MTASETPNVNSGNAKTYWVKTLGCKANFYDSQLMEAEMQKHGYRHDSKNPDVVVINSCTVTDEADKQSLQTARKIKKQNPAAKIVFTGCGAEVLTERIQKDPSLDFILGNRDKTKIGALLNLNSPERILGQSIGYDELRSKHPMDREWPTPESVFQIPLQVETTATRPQDTNNRTRVFLKIQEGCNSFCTFCIIPYGRGPARSLGIDAILKQIRTLHEEHGAQEVILTGTNIGDYGTDLGFEKGHALEKLVADIFEKTRLPRLRVSSLDPTEITDGLLERMRMEPRFCPHFHISVQSVDDGILKKMKRHYGFKELQSVLEKIQSIPRSVYVGMDLITGFPGETDEIFQEGLGKLKNLYWSRLHVFPYSEREKTPATRLPGSVPQQIRKSRSQELNALSLARVEAQTHRSFNEARSQKRSISSVLFEGLTQGPDGTRDWLGGYSPEYLRVLVPVNGSEALGKFENKIFDVAPQSILISKTSGEAAILGRL